MYMLDILTEKNAGKRLEREAQELKREYKALAHEIEAKDQEIKRLSK